jgi:hypothetical protein
MWRSLSVDLLLLCLCYANAQNIDTAPMNNCRSNIHMLSNPCSLVRTAAIFRLIFKPGRLRECFENICLTRTSFTAQYDKTACHNNKGGGLSFSKIWKAIDPSNVSTHNSVSSSTQSNLSSQVR